MKATKEVRQSLALAAAKMARKLSPSRFERPAGIQAIKLYYWNERPNFGDVLSARVVEGVSGQKVEWASIPECNMISTGSVYGWMRGNAPRYFRDVHVWGSGLHYPKQAWGTPDFLNHHLVRGPLTAMAAGDDNLPQGDPGLLGPDVYNIVAAPDRSGIGYIPHRSLWSQPDYIEKLQALPDAKLIDMRITDCRQVIEEMASCEIILSSSLHGLVVADALKIPNFWMSSPFEARKLGHAWKFMDYGYALGRMLPTEYDAMDVNPRELMKVDGNFDYFSNVDAVKKAIRDSFPYDVFGRPAEKTTPAEEKAA